MEAAMRRRIGPAPPPTPIATGKGLRSAAVDDRVLSRFLETSLRVPDLNLPKPRSSKSPIPRTLARVNFASLLAGEAASFGPMIEAVKETGFFLIDAGDFLEREEVRALIEAEREAFEGGEKKEVVLEEEASHGAYRVFRDKTQKVTSELEMVAESITKVLSEQIGNQHQSANVRKMHSVVCLRKHDYSDQRGVDETKTNDFCTLSLHIARGNHNLWIHSPDSTSFTLPAGFILVTIGRQLEELCDGELKAFNGEISLEPSENHPAPFSLEFMYSLPVTNNVPNHSSSRTISMMDQLLILLIVAFFYNLWS